MPQSPKSWEFDDDQTWPAELPSKLVEKLENDIAFFVQVARLRSNLQAPKLMKSDAKQITQAASNLLAKVRRFSTEHSAFAIVENYRSQATENLGKDLTVEELEQCRHGMSEFSLQYPLIGLIAYMTELTTADLGRRGGRPKADREVAAVREIIRCFALLNLDSSSGENSLLFRTCKVFFARAAAQLTSRGVKGKRAEPKSDAAISKYLSAAANT